MKKYLLLILIIILPTISFSQKTKKAIIIGIDGCRPDALKIANTPNIDNLIATGIFSPDALNDDITISGPGWSAILCGVWSDKHGVTNNNFSGNNYDIYPSIFKYTNDFDSSLTTLSICHWSPINDYIVQDYAGFKLNVSSDLEVATQAAAYLSQNDPDLVFLHFDDVDHAGHSYEFSPNISEYISSIESVDTLIGIVIQSIEQRSNYLDEDWLILVSTDHGGIGNSHGGNSLEEKNIFMIASGIDVDPTVILRDSSYIVNDAQNCLGDSIELNFDGVDDNVQISSKPIFDFGTNQDFTIECRVRTSTANDVAIVGNKNWSSGLNKGFVFSFKFPSGPEWKVNIGDGNNRADINTGAEIADNEWHTLSVSFDRNGLMKMYQNGAIVDSTDISFIGDITTSEGLFFGTDINGNFDYSGTIAEVRVWNTLINDQTIEEWYCTPIENSHPNYSDLIGYWKMNDGMSSTEVIDHSINENNGIINGAAWEDLDSMVVYNFDSTPRQTDIVPTVLTHLCIPIEANWGLDGTSLIPECTISNINEQNQLIGETRLKLFPNPTKDNVHLHLMNIEFNQWIQLEIYDSVGNKIYEQLISTNDSLIDISDFVQGVYLFTIKMENNRSITNKLIVF